MVNSAFPILSTPDLTAALAFYRDLLGGTVSYQFPADGEPEYVGIDLGASQIGLGADADTVRGTSGQRCALWLYVDDCDGTVERLRAAGTPVLDEPTDQPWGERVAKVVDPDGTTVYLGQKA